MNAKPLVLSIVLLATTSAPVLAEDFSTLGGIPAEAMSHNEMATVEGKFYEFHPFYGLVQVNLLGQMWQVSTGFYAGQRQVTLSDFQKAFPNSYQPSGPITNSWSRFLRNTIYTGPAAILNRF